MERVVICLDCRDPERCLARFRAKLAALSMVVTLDTSLASVPGSTHLHFRPRSERSGTLEYTMDIQGRKSWLSWHANRYRPWMDETVQSFLDLGCGA